MQSDKTEIKYKGDNDPLGWVKGNKTYKEWILLGFDHNLDNSPNKASVGISLLKSMERSSESSTLHSVLPLQTEFLTKGSELPRSFLISLCSRKILFQI